jgi:uncharacterized protein
MHAENTPWFKMPIMWLLIGIPASAVIVGIFFISLAVNTKDSLVRDNYYKDGLAINEELAWDKKAASLDVRMRLVANADQSELHAFIDNSRAELPNLLLVKFSHPTLKDQDQDALLQRIANSNEYAGSLEHPLNSRFYIQIEATEQEWRVRNDAVIENNSSIEFIGK